MLVYFIAGTFTRPLEKLVDGVRALGGGDFRYPLHAPARSARWPNLPKPLRECARACMRAQQRLLDAERLATIGRMASSISHDLRHPLTAVLANAEFLADAELSPPQREELYLEIRVAVNRLTDLVDSLLELSRPAESLNVRRNTGGAHHQPCHRTGAGASPVPQDRSRHRVAGLHTAQFDPRKMERVFYNLLLNGCQAAQACWRPRGRQRG